MDKAVKTIRFDDICYNCHWPLHDLIAKYFLDKGFHVVWAVSPLYHNINSYNPIERQRVYPKILNAYSNEKHFYQVDDCSRIVPPDERIEIASHGIIHVDHRLVHESTQEFSILVSCSLLKAKKFVPPFNKWTRNMEIVCKMNDIELIKFEDGWRSMEHSVYDPKHNLWYLHAREWTLEKIQQWFEK